MKKVLTIFSLIAVVTAMSGLTALAESVDTSLDRDSSGGEPPVIKVKWEMIEGSKGGDDSTDAGAQFLPSGQYQEDTTIEVCAIVSAPAGLSDINNVYGNVYYPEDIHLGPDHEADRQGCGQEVGNQFTMNRLSKDDGISLFCDHIRNDNYNLPEFNGSYYYPGICNADGQLQKETAAVYCGSKTLSYEDPSGDYRVSVMAQDSWGLDSSFENYFRYLDLSAFEIDFDSIDYGLVKLNTKKIINGDLTWDDSPGTNKASIRNIGNTRLQISVAQDDMGLGMTDGQYNVRYSARIGNNENDWRNYWPNANQWLLDELNLSELEEMDFAIEIYKFPSGYESGSGEMTLGSRRVDHLICNE